MGMKTRWSNCLKGNFGSKTSLGMKIYEKGMKTPYLKVPLENCIIILVPGLPPKGMKTLGKKVLMRLKRENKNMHILARTSAYLVATSQLPELW